MGVYEVAISAFFSLTLIVRINKDMLLKLNSQAAIS
jgi:hypothetical protein